jgi:hypothetical protein
MGYSIPKQENGKYAAAGWGKIGLGAGGGFLSSNDEPQILQITLSILRALPILSAQSLPFPLPYSVNIMFFPVCKVNAYGY